MKKVLVIDDDVEFLDEIDELLKATGYSTTVLEDGEQALKETCKMKPDIILLDLKMKISGFKIAIQLSCLAETKDIPIIAMTGVYTEKEHRLVMSACGIQKWLIKPVSPLDLITAIEQV